ncbi:YesN/AraC family two-component response regulator [Paenibacillus rhizosphaerae]|uniref:YesN/AraC family two-component response regulator n=1 Tax=Paenibacillus rhizosphaerae TaxID=297318 RepID=A0A839TJV8_9BACL|nr:response regulator [Paenibacillus rhizosphaerae]MBB3126922.1 YesN/AraC family two-component response regulator [Paenibacillus rhizosphaerae]
MNIFLVEDEHWALAELVELFRIYEAEHRIFAFGSGDEALAAAYVNTPDLVLTDITMPGVDGLELIKALIGVHPDLKAIVLSVHDQFTYAQQGMKLGVIDYLLKPVRKEVLYAAIDQTLLHITNDTKRKTERMHAAVAQMLLSSESPENEYTSTVTGSLYFAALLQTKVHITEVGEEDMLDGSIKSLFLTQLREQDIHCIDVGAKRKVLLAALDNEHLIAYCTSCLQTLYQQLTRSGIQVHMGYVVKQRGESLHSSYTSLNQMIEEQRKFGMSTFVTPDTRSVEAEIGEIWDRARLLQNFITQGEIQKGKESIHSMVYELKHHQLTLKQLMMFVSDLFYSLKYNLHASSKRGTRITALHEDIHVLQEFTTYDELSGWLTRKVFGLFGGQTPLDQKPKELVPILLNLIHSNYQHDLSLQQFAAEHHVSLGYLSRLFKTQTGHTFSDYLIRHRIEAAKTLLREGARITDVSRLVGYEDPKHFSHVFKRIVGAPPKTYAQRQKRKFTP